MLIKTYTDMPTARIFYDYEVYAKWVEANQPTGLRDCRITTYKGLQIIKMEDCLTNCSAASLRGLQYKQLVEEILNERREARSIRRKLLGALQMGKRLGLNLARWALEKSKSKRSHGHNVKRDASTTTEITKEDEDRCRKGL